MTLAPARGTRAWSNLCALWQITIDQHNGWTCRRCNKPIPARDRSAWQLGHPDDMTTGPTLIDDLEPEHSNCNGRAGAIAGNHARAGTTPPNWSL